ncbi:MAG: hypothetical protein JWL87_750 [Candidatus Adlerbacteria bacterium]|nr:hypothetical protein [Candidatus Adlerbacteria bacterium]
MTTPKLHFYYARPFDAGRRALFTEKGTEYPSLEEVMQKVGEYRTLWEEINENERIMSLLIERTGVTLPRDLEVWVFGKGMSPMSSPFLMPAFRRDGSSYTKDQFIEIFIHEILHRFAGFPENRIGIKDYWDYVRAEYAAEAPVTQSHIIIYAFLELILTELYGAQKTQEMINPNDPNYQRAVAIVKKEGAQKLTEQFRSFLK